jgi:hypothetical protein
MFIAFPPTFVFPSGLPKTFLPSHHIFYSHRLFDMKDGLPKYAGHKNEGVQIVDVSEDEDRSKGHTEQILNATGIGNGSGGSRKQGRER